MPKLLNTLRQIDTTDYKAIVNDIISYLETLKYVDEDLSFLNDLDKEMFKKNREYIVRNTISDIIYKKR